MPRRSSSATALMLFDEMRSVIVDGKLDKKRLRKMHPEMRDVTFDLAFSAARLKFREETGKLLKSIRGTGTYVIADAEYTTDVAVHGTRHRLLRQSEANVALLRDVQRNVDLPEGDRVRINHEELLQGRFNDVVKREMRRGGARKPEGLE